MGPFGVGQAVKRFEDVRLVRGGGRFHDDVNLPGQAHALVVRSVHAHARILSIDVSAALRAPGVLAVFTGDDLAQAGLGSTRTTLARTRPDGSPMFAPAHPVLVRDRVRCVGDPVAFLVAETVAQAEDAAELVRIEYEPLPSVTATAEAARPGSPPVWDECPDNVSNVFEAGDQAAADAAFARADHVVRGRYVITRVHAQYMEPRGALGVYDPGEDRYTLHADVQYPHRVRTRAGHEHLPGPRAPDPRHRGGHRRRLRDQGLAVPGAPAGAVGRAEAGTAGQVGVRAARGDPGRRARPGHRERGRAGPGRARADSWRSVSAPWRTWAPTCRRTGTSWRPS